MDVYDKMTSKLDKNLRRDVFIALFLPPTRLLYFHLNIWNNFNLKSAQGGGAKKKLSSVYLQAFNKYKSLRSMNRVNYNFYLLYVAELHNLKL